MPRPQLELVAVDDDVLSELVHIAVTDATADETTPPITAGPDWTPERIAWFTDLHRSCRPGLKGPLGEATWAIVTDGVLAGQVRLKRLAAADEAEIGLWVRRGMRGRGVGAEAVRLLLTRARAAGFRVIRAETTSGNLGSQKVLERNAFRLTPGGSRGIDAVLVLLVDPGPA